MKMKMKNLSKKMLGSFASAFCLASFAYAAPSYQFVDLGAFNAGHSMEASAINNRSQIAGVGHDISGVSTVFMWEEGKEVVHLGSPVPGATIYIGGINNHGAMTLTTQIGDNMGGLIMASYVWQRETGFSLLSAYPGSAPEDIRDINDDGLIVGAKVIDGRRQAVVWRDGVPTALGGLASTDVGSAAFAINNNGDIVGQIYDDQGYHGVLWHDGIMTRIPNASQDAEVTLALDINDHGAMAGYTSRGPWDYRPFVLQPDSDTPQILKKENQLFEAVAINNTGEVIGLRAQGWPESSDNAFYWTAETGMLSLYDLIDPASLTPGMQLQLQYAQDINDKGQIVGTALMNGQYHAFMLQPASSVPELDAMYTSLAGLAGLAFVRRRQQGRSARTSAH